MKILFLLFILFFNSLFGNERAKIIILDFTNQTRSSPQYNLLERKVAEEFRFIFSKSPSLEVFNLNKIYPTLLELQKKGDIASYRKIINKLRLYLNSQNLGSFDFLLAGEFYIQEGKINIVSRLYQNREDFKLVLEQKSNLEELPYWQFQACEEALRLLAFHFKSEVYDNYSKKCKNHTQNSEILESSLSLYRKIQSLEQELSFLNNSNQKSNCFQECVNEKQEVKILQCLQSCSSTSLLETQKLLSKAQVKGYKKLNTIPENEEVNWKNFKEEFFELILLVLKTLPEGQKLGIQGRVSKEFSSHPKIFEISKQKAENIKEKLVQEILAVDRSYIQLTNKLYVEACADTCFSEYPLQLDENSVTFHIRR